MIGLNNRVSQVTITLIVLMLTLLLSGCKAEERVKVLVPFGAPHMAILNFDDEQAYDVHIVFGTDPIVAAFGSGTYDIIFAPTQLGAKMYHSKPEYQLLGALTWGNLYLITSDETIENWQDLEGKTITLFGKNQTPDIILSLILDALSIEVDLHYVDALSSAASHFYLNPSEVVLVADPLYSKIIADLNQVSTLDLQNAYQEITGVSNYPQSSVFVKKDLSQSIIPQFVNDLEASITELNEQPLQSVEKLNQMGYDLTREILEHMTQSHQFRFALSNDVKNEIETYLDQILNFSPNLIDGKLPEDSFYWRTQ